MDILKNKIYYTLLLTAIFTMIETITAKDFNQYHIVNEILPITFVSGPIVEER